MDLSQNVFLFGLSVMINGPPLRNRWIFRRQIGVVITQHNVVEIWRISVPTAGPAPPFSRIMGQPLADCCMAQRRSSVCGHVTLGNFVRIIGFVRFQTEDLSVPDFAAILYGALAKYLCAVR